MRQELLQTIQASDDLCLSFYIGCMEVNSKTVTITSLDNIERVHDGAWVRYEGNDVVLNAAESWPMYSPPNRIVRRDIDGTSLWRERHPYYDTAPAYTWEEYREYLECYNLPVTLFNAHRNGRIGSSKSGSHLLLLLPSFLRFCPTLTILQLHILV